MLILGCSTVLCLMWKSFGINYATVKRVLYSVPSRLQGERLLVHVYDDQLIGYLGSEPVVTLSRQYAKDNQRVRQVDYRHLIGSLKKKPQAFRYSQIRDDLLPNGAWGTENNNITFIGIYQTY